MPYKRNKNASFHLWLISIKLRLNWQLFQVFIFESLVVLSFSEKLLLNRSDFFWMLKTTSKSDVLVETKTFNYSFLKQIIKQSHLFAYTSASAKCEGMVLQSITNHICVLHTQNGYLLNLLRIMCGLTLGVVTCSLL